MSPTGALCPAEHERHSIGVDFTPSVPPRSTMAALGARNRGTCVPLKERCWPLWRRGPIVLDSRAAARSPPTRSILPAFHRARVMGGPPPTEASFRSGSRRADGGRASRTECGKEGRSEGTDGEKGEQGVKGTEGRGGGRTIIK